MARYLDPATLPEDVARYVQAQVDSGRFATIEDVLAAAVEAFQQRDRAEHDWLVDARYEAAAGFAELDRGEGVHDAVADLMARVDIDATSADSVVRQASTGRRREVDDDLSTIELDATDERAIGRALASVREGRGVSIRAFRLILRRL